jgi:hypothetical protein
VPQARNLPKSVKVALMVRDKVAQTHDELPKWIKLLNPGLNTENWRIFDNHSEPKGQRLILHIDPDSFLAIKRTGYKIFTGSSQVIVKVLKDPEAQHQEELVLNTALSESVSEGEEMVYPLPQMTEEDQQKQKRKLLQASNLPQLIRGPRRREPGLITRKRQKRRGWRQTPLVNKE